MPGNKLCKKIMGENVVVKTTPVKIIADILALIAVIWLAVSICGQEWVVVKFQHQGGTTNNWGIWKTCNKLADGQNVCIKEGWITVCFVFTILAVIFSMVGTVFGVLSLTVIELEVRRRFFFIVAGAFMSLVSFLEVMVVIIYPVKFREDILNTGSVQRWDFDWTYGFAWGGMIFSVGSATLFFLPGKKQDRRTAYYTTRLPEHEALMVESRAKTKWVF